MAELEDEIVEEKTEETVEAEEVSFSDDEEPSSETEISGIPADPKKKKRKKKLMILGIIGGVILALILVSSISGCIKRNAEKKNMYTDVAVERRSITKSITGSSSIDPNDSYNVMTMKSGDITADYFKEGDTVKKGDKLYQIDDEDARNSLKTAQNAVTKAQQNYVDAVKQKSQTVSSNNIATQSSQNSIQKALNSLNDSRNSYNDQYIKSDISGKVASVAVKEGDTINNGTLIANVYSDTYMKIRLPFNEYDAESINVGDSAEVTVTGSGDVLYGTVTEKSSASIAGGAHTIEVYTTIEVTNPGALTESDRGSAVVNGVACADTANFEYISTQKIVSKTSGTIKSLTIAEGDSVYAGEQVAYVESTTAGSALSNAQINYEDAVLSLQKQVLQNDTYSQDSAIKNAQLSLDDAKISLKKAEDAVKDYVVEAPIEGTVVKKNTKAGDTRDSSNSTEALCVIYDLSSLKISIEVDETEIALVKTGLRAKITADAVEGEFEGEVTKVPVDGVNENGVTTYTIEIQIKNYGDLLPGMNVDAEIIVEEADNVLTVPVNSINRGDIIFVKEDGIERANDITDRIKSRAEENSKNGSKQEEKPQQTIPAVTEGGAPIEGGQFTPDASRVPMNIEIPDGYRAIQVKTGLNDNDYIEIKSGLGEGDMVRTLNTEASSEGITFGDEDIMGQMHQNRDQQMRQMQTGGGAAGPGGGGGMGGGPR